MLIHNIENESNTDDKVDYDNLCYVCYENIEENQDVATLSCGHRYHYKCILLVFKSALQKSVISSKQCPYCRKNSGYLPLKPGILPIKYIHEEYNSKGDMPIIYIPGKCKYILKRGPNSGNQCSLGIKTKDGYCKKHQKLIDAKKIKENNIDNHNKTEDIETENTSNKNLDKENQTNLNSQVYINHLYESILDN